MRCEVCLQVIEEKGVGIVIRDNPQGILVFRCKCGNTETIPISNLSKQKALTFNGTSVYEK